jgi:hypothetical protein
MKQPVVINACQTAVQTSYYIHNTET